MLSGFIPLFILAAIAIGLRIFWQGTADWRTFTGYTLLAVAAAMTLSLLLHFISPGHPVATKEAPAKYSVPAPSAAKQGKKAHTSKPTAKKASRKQSTSGFKVIALGRGRASLMIGSRIITLHEGKRSPEGWLLISATPLHADLLTPAGKRIHYEP